MTQQIILNGTVPNDGTGDNLHTAATKINSNFTELYSRLGLVTSGTNTQVDLLSTGTGPTTIGSAGSGSTTVGSSGTGNSQFGNTGVGSNGNSNFGNVGSNAGTSNFGNTVSGSGASTFGNGAGTTGPNIFGGAGTGSNTFGSPNPAASNTFGGAGTNNFGSPNATNNFVTGLAPDRVVVTKTNGVLGVDDNLIYGQVNRNLTILRPMKVQVSDFVIGTPNDDVTNHWVSIDWSNAAVNKTWGQITGGYSDQAMTKGTLVITAGSVANNDPIFKQNLTMTDDGRSGINADTPYCSLDVGPTTRANCSGILVYSHATVGSAQILQGFGTSAGNQIYQDASGYKIGQIGNQNNTFWLGTGGALNAPLTVGSRCITWDTDCNVTLSNANGTGINVPSPSSNAPITIGDPNKGGMTVPRDGSAGPSLGNPGTGAAPAGGGGSGGPNGGTPAQGNAGGQPGISVPPPWNSSNPSTPTNPQNPFNIRNPDGPINVGTPDSGGPGVQVPTPGSGNPLKVVTNLTPNRVVWTKPTDGTLGVSDSWTFDGTNSVMTGSIKTKYVEYTYAGTYGSTITPDWNNGTVQTFTVTGNFTLNAPVNLPTGATMTLILKQDGTGSRLMSPQSGQYIFASGVKTLTTTANAVDMLNIFNTGSGYMAALTTDYK
jgi:hypothetical protein